MHNMVLGTLLLTVVTTDGRDLHEAAK